MGDKSCVAQVGSLPRNKQHLSQKAAQRAGAQQPSHHSSLRKLVGGLCALVGGHITGDVLFTYLLVLKTLSPVVWGKVMDSASWTCCGWVFPVCAGPEWIGATSQHVRENQCHTIPMDFMLFLGKNKKFFSINMNFFSM